MYRIYSLALLDLVMITHNMVQKAKSVFIGKLESGADLNIVLTAFPDPVDLFQFWDNGLFDDVFLFPLQPGTVSHI